MQKLITAVTSAYRCEKYLTKYFENITALTNFDQIEVILIINDAAPKEKQIAEEFAARFPRNITLVYVPLETIAASTNRGFLLARTQYLTYADIDDIRVPNCYERQLKTLESNKEIDFTYGDFFAVKTQGEEKGKYIKVAEFNRNAFIRSSIVGPNHFFRKSLLQKSGYWDEQMCCCGDFDFQIRAAITGAFRKTPGGPLLYRTHEENSNSASRTPLQAIERTVIELRYGIYDKIDYQFYDKLIGYHIHRLRSGNDWIAISDIISNYEAFLAKRKFLIPIGKGKYLLNQYLRRPFRGASQHWLSKLGLLDRTKGVLRIK